MTKAMTESPFISVSIDAPDCIQLADLRARLDRARSTVIGGCRGDGH
jgi:hypothetical protein